MKIGVHTHLLGVYIPPLRQGNPGPGAVQVGLRPSVVVRKGYHGYPDSAAGSSAFVKGSAATLGVP